MSPNPSQCSDFQLQLFLYESGTRSLSLPSDDDLSYGATTSKNLTRANDEVGALYLDSL